MPAIVVQFARARPRRGLLRRRRPRCPPRGDGTMAPVRFGPLRALARAARRSLYRLRARRIPVVYDARYQRGVFGVPMDPLRSEKVLGALREAGLLRGDLVSEPRPASLQNLLRVHTPEYLQAVQEPEALGRVLGVEVPRPRWKGPSTCCGSWSAAPSRRPASRCGPGGSPCTSAAASTTRHPTRGSGSASFNDVAVAVRRLRGRGFEEPVLIVDLDLHDGNGTRRDLRRRPHGPHLLHPQRPLGGHRGRRVDRDRPRAGRGRRPLPRHAPGDPASRLRGGEAGPRRLPGRHRPGGGRLHRQLAPQRGAASSSGTAS